jgi:Mg2+-importing ATPase
MMVGAWLPWSPAGEWLGFTPLPQSFWSLLLLTVTGYVVLTQVVKVWLIRRGWV